MRSLNRLALTATTHCLTGCAIGEVLGMVLGTAFRWSNSATIVVSVVLAFLFGYGLTVRPLLASGLTTPVVLKLAFASDTASITIMEIVDNALMLLIPGAMNAPLDSAGSGGVSPSRCWSLGCRFPRQPLADRPRAGHAVVHAHHGPGHHH